MSKFKVGVIGTGGIFRGAHLTGWKAIPDAEIVAVADVNLSQASAFAQGTLTRPTPLDRPHTEEIKAFYDCVANSKPTPVPWTEPIKVIGLREAIYQAQEKGKEILLKL